MAQLEQYPPNKHEDLSSDHWHTHEATHGSMVYICNFSAGEVESGTSMTLIG